MIRGLQHSTRFARTTTTAHPTPILHHRLAVSSSTHAVVIDNTYCHRHHNTWETTRDSHVNHRPGLQRTTTAHHRRHVSVFASWKDKAEWHHPDFMSDASAKEKEVWLESMLQSNERVVDVEAYLIVLNALAEAASKDPGASRRSERWLSRLKEGYNVQPTALCYQAVIQAWANSNKETGLVIVARAERWLNDLLLQSELSSTEDYELHPTIECYNAFLDACTRGRGGPNKRRNEMVFNNAKKAEALLRQLYSQFQHNRDYPGAIMPNTDSFNFVIRGWTRCRKDDSIAFRILRLLRLMESHQRENPLNPVVQPNTKSYVMAMDAVITVGKLKAQRSIKDGHWDPDPSRNGLEEIKEAKAILNYMHDLYDAGVEGVIPNEVAYNVLIGGWVGLAGSKHHAAPFEAEKILMKMMSLKDEGFTHACPDRISYEKVILTWASSGHVNAGKRALWWLKKLWNDAELESNPTLLPSKRTYNAVIQALGASEGAEAAEELLLELGERFREDQSPELRPNSESFALVIRSWIQRARQHPDTKLRIQALERAVEWLRSLGEVEDEQDLSTAPELFLGVLQAALSCSRQRPEILGLAQNIFRDFQNTRYQGDQKAYTLLLEIGLNALSGQDDGEQRQAFLMRLVKDCSEDGFVSSGLVRGIANSPVYHEGWTIEESALLTKELFPEWPVPRSWIRNVPAQWVPHANDVKRRNFKISQR